MNVRDVMTRDVVTVRPEWSLKSVAAILAARGISGAPVVARDGEVIGVVSEGDILFKERGPSERRDLRWRFLDARRTQGKLKLDASTAGEAMTAPAKTIASWRSISSAAAQMLEEGVNRLPVVDDGLLVGIVTRADLVRAFARSDGEIAGDIRGGVLRRTLLLAAPDEVTVAVDSGKVTLRGSVDSRADAELLSRLARKVPGVVDVESSVEWRRDDRRRR
jgi:CBS domain-containing protein